MFTFRPKLKRTFNCLRDMFASKMRNLLRMLAFPFHRVYMVLTRALKCMFFHYHKGITAGNSTLRTAGIVSSCTNTEINSGEFEYY